MGKAFLEVVNGRYAGKSVVLDKGDVCSVGRRASATICPVDDQGIEPSHCAIAWTKQGVKVHDLSSSGTFVKGERVPQGEAVSLGHGDWLVCGSTLLSYLEEDALIFDSDADRLGTPLEHLTSMLFGFRFELFFLGDVTISEPLRRFLESGGVEEVHWTEEHRVALFCVPRSDSALETLVRLVWGQGVGVFLRSNAPVEELWAHFAGTAQRSPQHRYFDPRVLRALFPELRYKQLKLAFGPVHAYLMESQIPQSSIQFTLDSRRLHGDITRHAAVRARIPMQAELQEEIEAGRDPEEIFRVHAERLGIEGYVQLNPQVPFYSLKSRLQYALAAGCYPAHELERAEQGPLNPAKFDALVAKLNARRG